MKPLGTLGVASAAVVALAMTTGSASAQKQELKIAHFVTPKHSVSQWIENWSKKITRETNGEVSFKIFPGGQLGPPPKYYDIARRGQADVTWLVHGFTPGRFPLTELSNLPYVMASAEVGIKVLNDPSLKAKYLDPEHKGVRALLLMTHQPGNIHTARKAIRGIADMKGMRLRFASAPVKDFIAALGATPVGMPPTQIVDGMQKGTIDGTFIDYGGAGIAFKIGPVTKFTTEMYSYTVSFCICMNRRTYDRLSAANRRIVDASFVGVAKEVGHEWDRLDPIGKNIMVKAGMTPIRLSAEEDEKFRKIGAGVAVAKIAELEKKGLPAREVYDLMKSLAAKYEKDSRSFWTR